jgi:hypothetical protein
MKTLTLAFACLASASVFAADDAEVAKAQAELRAGCAQSYASFIANNPAGREYTGDKHPGDTRYYSDARPCTEDQLATYLDKADPALVMMAYPSAAGRPAKAKKPATGASAPNKP